MVVSWSNSMSTFSVHLSVNVFVFVDSVSIIIFQGSI